MKKQYSLVTTHVTTYIWNGTRARAVPAMLRSGRRERLRAGRSMRTCPLHSRKYNVHTRYSDATTMT